MSGSRAAQRESGGLHSHCRLTNAVRYSWTPSNLTNDYKLLISWTLEIQSLNVISETHNFCIKFMGTMRYTVCAIRTRPYRLLIRSAVDRQRLERPTWWPKVRKCSHSKHTKRLDRAFAYQLPANKRIKKVQKSLPAFAVNENSLSTLLFQAELRISSFVHWTPFGVSTLKESSNVQMLFKYLQPSTVKIFRLVQIAIDSCEKLTIRLNAR